MLCEYGCDTEAQYKLKNGKRCCEDKYQKCSFYRLKAKNKSSKYWKIEDNRIKASNISKKRFLNETENEKEERINRHIKVYYDRPDLRLNVRNKTLEQFSKETIENRKKRIKNHKDNWKNEKLRKEHSKKIRKVYFKDEVRKNHKIALSNYYLNESKDKKENRIRSHIFDIKKFKAKHPLFCKVEEIRQNIYTKKIEVKCNFCSAWFTSNNLYDRINAIEKGYGGNYFYCSDNCKHSCSCFNLRSDPNTKTSLQKYNIKVYKETNRSLKLHSYKLENFDKRGRNKFHLDHKFSIHKGFENNIDPKIIGHIKNLQMLPESENIKKGTTCSIVLQELLSYIK
jgi:hypothetical protein